MSRLCQITGAGPGLGHDVSHSHRRATRRFDVDEHPKRSWLPSENRHVRLTVGPRAIATVARVGHARGGEV